MFQGCGLFFLQHGAWTCSTHWGRWTPPEPTANLTPSPPPPGGRPAEVCTPSHRRSPGEFSPVPGEAALSQEAGQSGCKSGNAVPSDSGTNCPVLAQTICVVFFPLMFGFFVQYDVLGHTKETMSGNSGSLIRMGCWLYYLSNAWVFSMLYLLSFMVYWVYTT